MMVPRSSFVVSILLVSIPHLLAAAAFPIFRGLVGGRISNRYRPGGKQLAVTAALLNKFEARADMVFKFLLVLGAAVNLQEERERVGQ